MKEQEFVVPFMVLHRGDLEFMDTEEENISQGLSDEQMADIAYHLGKHLAEDWDDILMSLKCGNPELFDTGDSK